MPLGQKQPPEICKFTAHIALWIFIDCFHHPSLCYLFGQCFQMHFCFSTQLQLEQQWWNKTQLPLLRAPTPTFLWIPCRRSILQSPNTNMHCRVNLLIHLLSLTYSALPPYFLRHLSYLGHLRRACSSLFSVLAYHYLETIAGNLPINTENVQKSLWQTCQILHSICGSWWRKPWWGFLTQHRAQVLKAARAISCCVMKNRPSHSFHSFAAPAPLTSCPLLHWMLCSPEIKNSSKAANRTISVTWAKT